MKAAYMPGVYSHKLFVDHTTVSAFELHGNSGPAFRSNAYIYQFLRLHYVVLS